MLLRCVISLRGFSDVTSHAQRIIFLPRMKRVAEVLKYARTFFKFSVVYEICNQAETVGFYASHCLSHDLSSNKIARC